MKNAFYLFICLTVLCPLLLHAQKFDYNYKGVDFKVKVKDGKAIVYEFDNEAASVVIPAQVVGKNGKSYQISVVDLYDEASVYKTNTVVVEPGITEVEDYCFIHFKNLSVVYLPNSIERIGKKAFNSKHAPSFKMPSTISEAELLAGRVVYPRATLSPKTIDPLKNIDLSAYGQKKEDKDVASIESENAPKPAQESITPGTSDIDYNIPTTNSYRANTFCIIIANEVYKQKDTPNVKYAAQDGDTFQSYCSRTLGLPKENIHFVTNASFLQMKSELGWLKQIGEVYGKDANFIVYYAGHGVPDEKGNCKLIPSDVSINDVGNGFGLRELYSTLGNITTSSALVLIDACFSGNDRADVAAIDDMHRGIVREVKNETVTGDVVVLTAASGTETALSYDEKAHGLFSYFLMKKLQETKGDTTIGELYDYIKKEVMRKSIVAKGKKQTPSVSYSSKMQNIWKNIKL